MVNIMRFPKFNLRQELDGGVNYGSLFLFWMNCSVRC